MAKLQPMLAGKIESSLDLDRLTYPLIVSPKLDGIRCMIHPTDGPVSRTFKPIPNYHIQKLLFLKELEYLDGELIIGEPTAHDVMSKCQSGVMSQHGTPEFTYNVFDMWANTEKPYEQRLVDAATNVALFRLLGFDYVQTLESHWAYNKGEVLDWEKQYVAQGFEGIMLRSTAGVYKFGRSSLKQQGLLKWKRMEDAEATISGFVALERNTNVQQRDAFGHAKRSSHSAGRIAVDLLGAFTVEHPVFGTFNVGSGLDDALRAEIWANQSAYLGKTITIKFQPVGVKEKPRFPIFKGFRAD